MTTTRFAEEEGAVAVLYAILLVVMLGVAALTIDLGALRADRHAAQLTSDIAVTAGALSLSEQFDGSSQEACERAWDYFLENNPDADPGANPCDARSEWGCDASTGMMLDDRSVVGEADPYRVTIVWPVLEDDPFMEGDVYASEIDGEDPCERIAMNVSRVRGFLFGPVLDPDYGEGSTGAFAVARATTLEGDAEVATLVVLEREECRALYAQGQSKILVMEGEDDDGEVVPGIIAVDSEADPGESTCSAGNPRYAIAIDDNQHARVKAGVTEDSLDTYLDSGDSDALEVGNGMIISHALQAGNHGTAYDEADVPERLEPEPVAGPQFTRSPVDHRYNCKDEYDDDEIDPCEADDDPHIDDLRASVGDEGSPGADYTRFTTWMDDNHPDVNNPCTQAPDLDLDDGDWWVDCEGGQGFVVNGSTITFGEGNVVFDGGIDLRSDAILNVNHGADDDAFVFVREGDFERGAQAGLSLNRTFLYLDDGHVDFGAGDQSLTWIAPQDDEYRFHALALWSESSEDHEMGGQAPLAMEGVFFTPNARFVFSGQPSYHAAEAQFVARQLRTQGQADLRLVPNRDWMVPIVELSVLLIR